MPRLAAKHPLPIRVSHWLNVPVLAVMAWSGMLIYWAYDPYRIRWAGVTLVRFFPDWFYRALDLESGLAAGMAYHFAFAWPFALNGLFYVGYLLLSGEWRVLAPRRASVRGAWDVVLHDLRIRKGPLPPGKFNHAQRVAYTGVVLMGAGSVVTGLAMLKPTQLGWLTAALGGYQTARLLHFALTAGFVLFVAVHVAQVVKAGWNNFQSMVTGYEAVPRRGGVPCPNCRTRRRPRRRPRRRLIRRSGRSWRRRTARPAGGRGGRSRPGPGAGWPRSPAGGGCGPARRKGGSRGRCGGRTSSTSGSAGGCSARTGRPRSFRGPTPASRG